MWSPSSGSQAGCCIPRPGIYFPGGREGGGGGREGGGREVGRRRKRDWERGEEKGNEEVGTGRRQGNKVNKDRDLLHTSSSFHSLKLGLSAPTTRADETGFFCWEHCSLETQSLFYQRRGGEPSRKSLGGDSLVALALCNACGVCSGVV